jgi:2-polyprenyl-3-methyl-5-hydroxy-6-metoxy-1,4-benzoquinol methylase
MNSNNRLGEEKKNLCFQRYYDSFYKGLHEWRDYEKSSTGYSEWYHDCLPSDREARILDIGCGDGKFLFFLKRNGYVGSEGLELSACLADIAGKRVGCPVHVVDDTVDFLSRHRGRYDTVTMNDVLEHIPKEDIIHFLSVAREALVPGGNLVVNVPQVSGFTSLYCRYVDFTHQIIFSEMSLRQVLLLAGFEHIRFIREKWPFKLTPRHLCYRLLRWLWFSLLKLIYFIEQPYEIRPASFQSRLVASAS